MCSCTAMRKGIKMTTHEFEKWMEEMDSKPETRHKLDLVSPMIANIGVEAQNTILMKRYISCVSTTKNPALTTHTVKRL